MVRLFDDRKSPVPDELVLKAQQGDRESRDFLIKSYKPYIVKVTSLCCRRFVREGVDDEVSVALLAFNEAIDSYRRGQKANFLSLARLVIERRLTDYYRHNKKTQMAEIPFSGLGCNEESDEYSLTRIERAAAEKAFTENELLRDRREEILHFRQLLAGYHISLDELIKISPRHASARRRAVQAAQAIAAHSDWRNYFIRFGELPLKELDRVLPVSRKTLERQRKYIVALTLVFIHDLPFIREYLKGDDDCENQGTGNGSEE